MAFNIREAMETKEETKIMMEGKLDGIKSKACLFNLIVFTHDAGCEKKFSDLVEMVAQHLPCRIIFIQGNKPLNEIYVKISTEQQKENKNIFFDKIIIQSATKDLDKVPFIIYPIIIPDVPVYLLWGSNPLREKILLSKLKTFATRLIFESEYSDNIQFMSKELLDHINHWDFDILDLNWARFGGWREGLAKTFDSEERFNQLKNSSSIKIKYNTKPNDDFCNFDTQAIYLQGWLAGQLGWVFEKLEYRDQNRIIHYKGSQPVEVQLIPENHDKYTSEEIIEFEVSDQSGYSCTITRKDENHIVVHMSNQSQCIVPFNLLLSSLKGKTFIQDVFYYKISPHYHTMLKMISQANWRKNEH